MGTKYTQEQVANIFANAGCVLLSTYYFANEAVQYQCSCGAIALIRLNDFLRGHRCKNCGKKKMALVGVQHWHWQINRNQLKQKQQIRKRMYDLLHGTLLRLGKVKEEHTSDILGYSPTELMAHLQAHWNWANIDPNNYHIDHILPIQAFIEHGISDPKIINALDNLRPCRPFDNLSKSDWYNEDQFIHYCEKYGLVVQRKEVQHG